MTLFDFAPNLGAKKFVLSRSVPHALLVVVLYGFTQMPEGYVRGTA